MAPNQELVSSSSSSSSMDTNDLDTLPIEILEDILGRLPIQEAVRTSVLSRNWRQRWLGVPNLQFDFTFQMFLLGKGVKNFEIWLIILKLLLVHRGTLRRFSLLRPPLLNQAEHAGQHFLDDILLHLTQKNVSSLRPPLLNQAEHTGQHFLNDILLHLTQKNVSSLSIIPSVDNYSVPNALFDMTSLTNLYLTNSTIVVPRIGFFGFSMLETLHLDSIWISSEDMERVISACQLLRSLFLEIEGNGTLLCITGPRLESITFNADGRALKLNCVALLSKLIVFSRLVDTSWDHIPQLQYLKTSSETFKTMSLTSGGGGAVSRCHSLRLLELFDFCFGSQIEVDALCSVLKNCNIMELRIDARLNNKMMVITHLPVSTFDKLSIVSISGFDGSNNQLWFLEMVLFNSPALLHATIKSVSTMPFEVFEACEYLIKAQAKCKILFQ